MNKTSLLQQVDPRDVQTNWWGTNLAIRTEGERIQKVGFLQADGRLLSFPEAQQSFVYILGRSSSEYHDGPLANLMRMTCHLIKDKVEALLDRPKKAPKSFLNGGILPNGNLIEEVIIHTPTHGHEGVFDYQAIFSIFPTFRAKEAGYATRRPLLRLNGEDRYIDGIHLSEDVRPRRFDSSLGTLRVDVEYDLDWVRRCFAPELMNDVTQALCVNYGDFMRYCETVSQLIFMNYFGAKSYALCRQIARKNAVTDVDLEKCGLYHHRGTLQRFYVYRRSSTLFNLYHCEDDSGVQDLLALDISELSGQFVLLEGRNFIPNVEEKN